MKSTIKFLFTLLLISSLSSCSDDDDNVGQVLESEVYILNSVADPAISGTATFIENGDNSTTIQLDITGTPNGGMHPAHIHFNTAAEGGNIAVSLGTVDGTTGFSTITVSELDNGTPVTYDDLITFDGYINVHLGPGNDLATIVAQGDIGQNELTGESISYTLGELDVPGISGTVTFTERINGEALAVIDLVGTPDGGMHPAHIHEGSVATAPGAIIFTFNPVNGTTGMSKTNVTVLDNDADFNYNDVLTVDGYVNVHLGPGNDLATIVAQGNVGINN